MTGPRVDVPSAPHIPTLAEFEQLQYLAGPSAQSVIATPEAGKATVPALSRIPTLDEFNKMQGMSGPAIKALKIPALPPMAPRDALATIDPTKVGTRYSDQIARVINSPRLAKAIKQSAIPGLGNVSTMNAAADVLDKWGTAAEQATDPHSWSGELVRNIASPALHHPWMTGGMIGATMIPVVGPVVEKYMAGSLVSGVALYGAQKYYEQAATPEARKIMEADPERISGKSAIIQAGMVGLLPLLHIGAKLVGGEVVGAGANEALSAPQAEQLGAAAATHGLPETANPYPAVTELAKAGESGHAKAITTGVPAGQSPELPAVFDSGAPQLDTPSNAAQAARRTVDAAAKADRPAPPVRTGEPPQPPASGGEFPIMQDPTLAPVGERPTGMTIEQWDALGDTGKPMATPEEQAAGVAEYNAALAARSTPGRAPLTLTPEQWDAFDPSKPTTEPAAPAPTSEPVAAGTAPAQAERTLAPIEGTGDLKTRGLSKGVEESALAAKLTETLGDLPEYRTMKVADQARQAVDLLTNDPARARRVALGEEAAPTGLHPEAVFKAVEERAKMDGDVATLRDLAHGKLTEEGTTMGQRLRLLGERDPESPVEAIQSIIDIKKAGTKNILKARAEVLKAMRETMKEPASAKPQRIKDWSSLVDTLKC